MLYEFVRVLKKNGTLIISTPNKEVSKSDNDFHVREFTITEFEKLLSCYFNTVKLYSQKIIFNLPLATQMKKNAITTIIKLANRYDSFDLRHKFIPKGAGSRAYKSLKTISEPLIIPYESTHKPQNLISICIL